MTTIDLQASGRTTDETLPYDAMDLRGWHRRARVVYDAPPSIVATYMPLASKLFATQCKGTGQTDGVVVIGDLGVGLALDQTRMPVVSVETMALLQLIQSPGAPESVPDWLRQLQATWTSGMALFAFHPQTGWRATFAEHRLWSAILLRDGGVIKTPYCKPTVRGWYAPVILDDLTACVGASLMSHVAATVAHHGFDGAPDLVLYRPSTLWLVEVKSTNDALRDSQVEMLKHLSRIVSCQICCPPSARKRMADAMSHLDAETTTDESQ